MSATLLAPPPKAKGILEAKPEYARRVFPAGQRRYIHVNPYAVHANRQGNKKYPTIILTDEEGRIFQYHAVEAKGLLTSGSHPFTQATVFIVTEDEIVAYLDLAGEMFYEYKQRPAKAGLLSTGWKKLRSAVRSIRSAPLISCMTLHVFDKD